MGGVGKTGSRLPGAARPRAAFRAVQDVDPEGTFFSQIVDGKVLDAIDALPEESREVLVLSDVESLPYGEIASILGVPA